MQTLFVFFFRARRNFLLPFFVLAGLSLLPTTDLCAQYITRAPAAAPARTSPPPLLDNDSEYSIPGKGNGKNSYAVPVYPHATPTSPHATTPPAQQRYYEDLDRAYQYPTYNEAEDNPYYYEPYTATPNKAPAPAPIAPTNPYAQPHAPTAPVNPYAQPPAPKTSQTPPSDVDEEYYYPYQQTNDPAYYPLYYDH